MVSEVTMTEFTIHLSNRPGQLASLATVMADADVNIEALAAFGIDDMGVVRLVVTDAEAARRVIEESGLVAEERRVVTTVIPHQPGALAGLTQGLAEAGVLNKDEAESFENAYRVVLQLALRAQIENYLNGRSPSYHLNPSDLSARGRESLKQSLKAVSSLQDAVAVEFGELI